MATLCMFLMYYVGYSIGDFIGLDNMSIFYGVILGVIGTNILVWNNK